ncbi:MAG: phosphonopyruvate decarboxylase [Akkermansia sp.]|nr:phosphonopyruvate decarboxylase [Akkermansia sp.]
MIEPSFLVDALNRVGIDFYTGVPDSLLKDLCAHLANRLDKGHHVTAANEGAAVALAAGHYLATGKPAVVYMQNSGQGNIINPLASLTDEEVYHIPVLLIIGWRGRPGMHDEPQHVKQGKVTTGLLNTMGINYDILSKDETMAGKQIEKAVAALHKNNVYALVIEKGTFVECKLTAEEGRDFPMSREEAIQAVAAAMGDRDVAVSTTGMISRELFETRAAWGQVHGRDFLTVGSMGHASQIALGIAFAKKDRMVWCLDGDGAAIMHMGSMAIVGQSACSNLVHVVFNNGAHDSVGGQPTVGMDIDIPAIARATGYAGVFSVQDRSSLADILQKLGQAAAGPILLEIKVRKGNRKDLGRPTTTPAQNKEALMAFLQS